MPTNNEGKPRSVEPYILLRGLYFGSLRGLEGAKIPPRGLRGGDWGR